MAEGGFEDLTDSLDDKVGGVPVWVWGGGIGLLLMAAIWFYRRNNSSGITPDTYDPNADSGDAGSDADPQNSDIGLPNGPVGDWLSENPGSTAFPVGGAALPTPITNGQWARQAIDGLIGKGDDPTLVNNALTKYVSGQGLTAAEKSIVNTAITLYGSLPEGAKAIVDAVIPGPAKPASYRGYGWYRVQRGDKATAIAKQYKISLGQFYAWNGINALKVGEYVKIRGDSNPASGYKGR